jgi:hypothetical protein
MLGKGPGAVVMSKNILLSAGGTATAWHLASLISEKFRSYFNLFVCDINPPHLIPASRLAQRYFQVPRIDNPDYHSRMLELFDEHGIDIYVPLIDADVHRFPIDATELVSRGVRSTGILSSASAVIGNKRTLSAFLESHGFCTPRTVSLEDVARQPGRKFFIKPEQGFGSRSARVVEAEEVLRAVAGEPGLLVQELCGGPEVTVEVFNRGAVLSLCRERLETKAGVCTKARVFEDDALHSLAERLCGVLDLPIAFCFQVMLGPAGEWLITDLNPRLGAGTALSTAYGWSLASAALTCWGDLPLDPQQFLRTLPGSKYVVRVYQEKVMD